MKDNTVSIDLKAAENLDAIRFSLFSIRSRMLQMAMAGQPVDVEVMEAIESHESELAHWMAENGFRSAFEMRHLPEEESKQC